MNSVTFSAESINSARAMLSLRETIVLGDIPEKLVRKDIENGWLKRRSISTDHRLWFRWVDVFLLAGVYRTELSGSLRKKALDRVEFIACNEPVTSESSAWRCSNLDKVRIGNYLFIDFNSVADDVGHRIEVYAEGLNRIEKKSTVLGG